MTPESIKVFLPISEIFPDIESDLKTFKSLLRELSRTDALFWCARLKEVHPKSCTVEICGKCDPQTRTLFEF